MIKAPKNKFTRNMLITTSGILIAVLTVWAQLWAVTAQLYDGADMTSVGWGLSYIYWGIFALIWTIVITVIRGTVKTVALALFGFSLTITVAEVLFSLIPVLYKTSQNENLWEPLLCMTISTCSNLVIMIGIPSFLCLVWVLFACWIPRTKGWFSKLC